MKTTPCKGCGKPIVWGRMVDGTNVPLDPRPPVYQADIIEGEVRTVPISGGDGPVMISRNRSAMVSHFATCPKAEQFSGSAKR